VLENAKCFAAEFKSRGYNVISGGTDTHLILLDLQNKNVTGKQAEHALDLAGITLNKNMVPFDPKSPFITSGIRIGSPALTTRGMGLDEVKIIVDLIDKVIMNNEDESVIDSVKKEVKDLCKSFPIY
jgi:glycine hydroxymethyltransferase